MCSWTEIFLLQQRGIDCVTRLSKRTVDFRRGQRLGDGDRLVPGPTGLPPDDGLADLQIVAGVPHHARIRVQVEQPGFRSRTIVVVTTLLNAEAYSKTDLADLYRSRWNNELDLRSLKRTMQMEILAARLRNWVRKESLDAHPRLQSHSHDHGSSGKQTRPRTAFDQLQSRH